MKEAKSQYDKMTPSDRLMRILEQVGPFYMKLEQERIEREQERVQAEKPKAA